jgi:type IV pilus assembly protein PilV
MSITHSFYSQRGATLVEVLIASVIIGVGLLGIASLQSKALQGSTEAEYRAKATDFAWTLADRIRANMPADNSYITTSAISSCPTPNAGGNTCTQIPGQTPVMSGACSSSDLAAEDIETLFCGADFGIRDRLPGSTLEITCADNLTTDADACSPGSQMTITVTWLTRSDPFKNNDFTDRVVMPVIPGAP